MNEERVTRRLRELEPPDAEAAEARARAVMRSAFASAPSARRRRPRAFAALAAAAILGAGLLTPPGEAVADWVTDLVESDDGVPGAQPALTALPGGGRLLVSSPAGTWVVQPDGARRRLGAFETGAWSPQGRFVAVARGRQLAAVDPVGNVRWALARPEPVRSPRWAGPDGFRVAYLNGTDLRVVAGDGSGDRRLAADVAPVAPAWRPVPGHRIALVDRDGSVRLTAADRRSTLWSTPPGPRPRALEWSSDGRRLLVHERRGVRVLDARGAVRGMLNVALPVVSAAISPDGRRVALVRYDTQRRRSTVLLATGGMRLKARVLFAGSGRFGRVTWSPDGDRLLLSWPGADQWLFLPVDRPQRLVAIGGVAEHFDPGADDARAPVVNGWCCP